jgi:hypothetical protein
MRSTGNGSHDGVRRFLAGIPGRRNLGAIGLLCALLAAAPPPAGAVPSSVPDAGAYITDGPVNAIARAGGRTYLGGAFTRVGRRSGSGVVLSSYGTDLRVPAEIAGGDVRAAISDGNGGWFIGGTFTAVGGLPHVGLAHITAGGAVDSGFNPAVTNLKGEPATVNTLLLSPPGADGARTLYVGGYFAQIGVGDPESHTNLAALRADDGTPISQFVAPVACRTAQQPACLASVRALALAQVPLPVNGTDQLQPVLFVGGDFTLAGPGVAPSSVKGAVAFWGVGAVDATNGPVMAGQIMSSDFTPVPWAPILTGVNDTEPPGASVRALQVGPATSTTNPATATPTLTVYIGGWSIPASQPPAQPFVRAFQFKMEKATRRVAANSASLEFTNWKPMPSGCSNCAVRAMVLADPTPGSTLYFGGDFTAVGTNSTPAGHLATIPSIPDPTVTTFSPAPSPLGPGVDKPVLSLAHSAGAPGTLFVGGSFASPARGVAALDSASGIPLSTWTSPSPDTAVQTVVADGSTTSVFVGGEFHALESRRHAGLAAFDSSGVLLDDWNAGVSSASGPAVVHALVANSSTVYVGGRFDSVTGIGDSGVHANLAAVDAVSGNVVDDFGAGASLTGGKGEVLSLSLVASQLYVGGAFDRVGGQARDNLAAVDSATGAATGWNPGVTGNDAVVRAILPACGAVYVGGWFNSAGAQTRENLAALDPETGAATPWDPHPDGDVLALARHGSTILAGGNFASVGGASRQKLAGLNAADGKATAFDAEINPNISGSSVGALAVTDSALYVGGQFPNLRDSPRSNLASVDPVSGAPTSWDPQADGRVDALAVGDDAVSVGGEFQSLGAAATRGFARFGTGAGSAFTPVSCLAATGHSFDGLGSGAADGGPLTSLTPPRARRAPVLPPQVSKVTVSPATARLGGPALTLSFRLSRASRVRLRFERRQAVRCPLRRRRAVARSCVRYVRFVDVTAHGRPGLNRISFPGQRAGGRRFVPGRYRVKLWTLPIARGALQPLASFRMVKGGRR